MALRRSLSLRLPRQLADSPFHLPPPEAQATRQANRLDFLLAHPAARPRRSDPPLPPRPYPSPLDAPLRPATKPQRRAWLGPQDRDQAQPQPPWVVNPESPRAAEARGRVPNQWFVRRVDASGFLPVYSNRAKSQTLTLVRKVEGNSTVLLHALLNHLATLPHPTLLPSFSQGADRRAPPPSSQHPPTTPPSAAAAPPKPTTKGVMGRVNPTTGHLEIKGPWRAEVRKWLVDQGM